MSNEVEQAAQRQAKLAELIQLGVTPYPTEFDRTESIVSLAGHVRLDGPLNVSEWR